jgi:hypothetical protein
MSMFVRPNRENKVLVFYVITHTQSSGTSQGERDFLKEKHEGVRVVLGEISFLSRSELGHPGWCGPVNPPAATRATPQSALDAATPTAQAINENINESVGRGGDDGTVPNKVGSCAGRPTAIHGHGDCSPFIVRNSPEGTFPRPACNSCTSMLGNAAYGVAYGP